MLTKILVADASDSFRLVLTQTLSKQYNVLSCGSGTEALEQLRKEKPDFFVMDLMLPGLDGLSLLDYASKEEILPSTLVTSLFFPDHIVNALQQSNVVYLMSKPCDMEALTGRIQDLISEFSPQLFFRPAPRSVVTSVLFELGFSTKRQGYHHCRDAILLLRDNPGASLSKEVYPALAQSQRITQQAVEKSIRDAISGAYNRRNDGVWARYFPMAPNGLIPKPTNKAFLNTMTEMLFNADLERKEG